MTTPKRSNETVFRPGQAAPHTGRYEIVGPRGSSTGEERKMNAGRPFPPTPKRGQAYVAIESSGTSVASRRSERIIARTSVRFAAALKALAKK